jgi:hypothetical protein
MAYIQTSSRRQRSAVVMERLAAESAYGATGFGAMILDFDPAGRAPLGITTENLVNTATGQRVDYKNTEGGTKRNGRAHVPADHRAGDDAKLASHAADQVPDLPTLKS